MADVNVYDRATFPWIELSKRWVQRSASALLEVQEGTYAPKHLFSDVTRSVFELGDTWMETFRQLRAPLPVILTLRARAGEDLQTAVAVPAIHVDQPLDVKDLRAAKDGSKKHLPSGSVKATRTGDGRTLAISVSLQAVQAVPADTYTSQIDAGTQALVLLQLVFE